MSKASALERNHTVNTLSPSPGQSDLLHFVASAHNIPSEIIFPWTTVRKWHFMLQVKRKWKPTGLGKDSTVIKQSKTQTTRSLLGRIGKYLKTLSSSQKPAISLGKKRWKQFGRALILTSKNNNNHTHTKKKVQKLSRPIRSSSLLV